jgi:hypothetical protein
MFLSTEQTRAVMHGIDNKLSWRLVERPVGRQHLPAWVKGAKVDWHEGYNNSPSVRLIVNGDVRDWPEKRFRKEGKHYRAYHEDGRLEQYAHGGAISLVEISRFRSADGTLRQYRREGPQWTEGGEKALGQIWVGSDAGFVDYGYEPGEWIKVMLPATTAQDGFGGAHIPLLMEDGSELILRGPWHVGAPAGYAEVSYAMRGERWGARAGLYVTLDLLVRIMATFQAHLELAEVTYGGCTTIEPMKPEWDVPKRIIYEREWLARKAACEAAKAEAA